MFPSIFLFGELSVPPDHQTFSFAAINDFSHFLVKVKSKQKKKGRKEESNMFLLCLISEC